MRRPVVVAESGSTTPPRRGWRAYAVAVVAVVASTAARAALTPSVGPTEIPFIFFFPAVTVAAWYGGAVPGTLALALAAGSANWFFIDPTHSMAMGRLGDVVALLAFVTSCAFILVAVEAMHRARHRLIQETDERRRADAVQAETRELLATTVASIGDAVIVTDARGDITFLNAEAGRLTGFTKAEAVGQPVMTVFQIVNEDTREPAENPVDKVLRSGITVGLANHTVLIAKSGKAIPIDDSGAPVRRSNGEILGVVLVFRDVTAQRATELARARLAAIVEHSGDAIVAKNLDGVVQSWNAAADRLFGYKPEEIIGQPITRIIPQDRLQEEADILERLRHGQPSEYVETIRVTKSGRLIPVSVSVSPLRDAEQRLIGASKIVRDITDIVAARQALARERELLVTTLESIGDAVIVTNAEGRVTFINTEAERLTGWSQAAAEGLELPRVFHIINEQSRQPVENPVDKVFRLGVVVGLANHTILIDKLGTERPVDDSAAPIRLPDGALSGVVLVFRDVTERRRAEKALQEADRRKDEFLAILSHELRNPLAPIRIAVAMLRKLSPEAPELRHLRDIIDRQTLQLTRLLDDLLDVSRIGSGKITLRKDAISLGIAVSSAIETARPAIDAHRHELIVESSPEPIEVEGDLSRLSQVFSNLLSNAAKFTESAGRITVTIERDGGDAVVRVRDTGVGIAADKLDHVFEMFAQVDQPLERGHGGLGVGLSLSKKLVELHGGHIEARSEGLGRGSEFIVRLPIARQPAGLQAASPGDTGELPTQSRRRILVADDNVDSTVVLAAALRLAGHDVFIAHDGQAAIEAAATFDPDVAILDVGMPRMSGYDVARRLRDKRNQRILLIAVTGWGQDDDRRRAREAGFDHHLTKPVDLRAVYDLLAVPAGASD